MSGFGQGVYESVLPGIVRPPVHDPVDVDPRAAGMEKIGGAELTAAATSLTVGPFATRDSLLIQFRIPITAAAVVLAVRFGTAAIDSAAGAYWHRNFSSADVVGLATFANTETPNPDTMIVLERLAAATNARQVTMSLINMPSQHKACSWSVVKALAAVSAAGETQIGAGAWLNTTTPINMVQLISVAGTANFNADTGIGVYGANM